MWTAEDLDLKGRLDHRRGRAVRERWGKCATMADIGELTAQWILGAVPWSPTYAGGPHGETVRHRTVLCRVNRAGAVTDNMNDESPIQNADVLMFVRRGRVPRLYMCCRQFGVEVAEVKPGFKRETIGYYGEYVQDSAVKELQMARLVVVSDPVRYRYGRRSPLWRALKLYGLATDPKT